MNTINKKYRDLLGVSLWHEKGYTGKRGKTGTGECFEGELATSHGKSTKAVFLEIAPDREVVYLPCSTAYFPAALPDAIANGVDTLFLSMSSAGWNDPIIEAALLPYVDRFTYFVAAGNEGNAEYNGMMKSPNIYGVGALEVRWSNEQNGVPTEDATVTMKVATYSSISEFVDFVSPTNFYNGSRSFGGTSCATPVLCGMAALVNDFFIDKTGKPLGNEEMYRFLKDNTADIGESGKDESSGWGYVVLPDPDTIDIAKYQPAWEKKMKIIETNWNWAYALTKRNRTTELIIHHAAGNGSAEQIHNFHLSKGWAGIAYNYYVRKDGSIYRGRPEDAVGGHTGGNHNSISIGVCFEGNFQVDIMGESQFDAGVMLVNDIRTRYPNITILRHGDVNATACPGENFPFKEMIDNMTGEEIYIKLTEYLSGLQESDWSRDEGAWAKAVAAGVVDGTNPRGFITREQMIAVLERLKVD